MSTQLPAGAYPARTKMSTLTYDYNVLPGTIPLSGSVSSLYDLSDWTLVGMEIPGTLASGTVQFWGAANVSNGSTSGYRPVCGTSGAPLTAIGTLGNQVLLAPSLNGVRYLELVAAGTQTAAQVINLLVK